MRKSLIRPFPVLFILILITVRALALDNGSFEIKVMINKGPNVENFSPCDGYTITEGDILEISVEATDPNSDILQYQFYINAEVKQPWTAESLFSYTLTEDDIGLKTIKAEITDGIETVTAEEVEIFVFRSSPKLPTAD